MVPPLSQRNDPPPDDAATPPTQAGSWSLDSPPTRPGSTGAWSGVAALFPGTPWPAGHELLDDYEVEGVLGQGGMGIVYCVRQKSTRQALAVKRARLIDAGNRRRFLAELQLWIDLPAHPHLAACRFFRTVGDEVVIFMDLAADGSLADRIGRHQLTLLTDVLDIAIQVGEGLNALHECGLVHQDVKPANVLLSAEGVATVSDFGLARARSRAAQPASEQPGQSVLVSGGAMTPAYCSPEQAAGRPVSRRTDIWSWGVLVLEMFVGRVPCCDSGGPRAPEILTRYLQAAEQSSPVERMPPDVASVLSCCFSDDPAGRWATLAEAVDVLIGVYRDHAGHPYPRAMPARMDRGLVGPSRRPSMGLGQWDSPRKWLALALVESGRDPTEAEAMLPPPAASARAQAVADLTAYDEAAQRLQQLVDDGRIDLEPRIQELCVQRALVHLASGDSPGALKLFDQAIADLQRLVHHWRRYELTPRLVSAYLHKAGALRTLGDNEQSVALCDRVISLWQSLDNRRARRELRDDLAWAYLQKGRALRNLGRAREAAGLFDRAVDLWQQLVEREGQPGPANDLAEAYLNQANALAALGKPAPALDLCDRALYIRRRLARDGQADQEADLARALLGKASVLRGNDRARDALPLYEQAIACWKRLVEEQGREDFAHELARAYLSRANADRTLGEPRRAAEGCALAAAIWERLVHQEGRRELTLHLARAWMHKSNALRAWGQAGEALSAGERGIELWERLVLSEERTDLGNDLARAYVGKAQVLRQLGRLPAALNMFDQSAALRRRLVDETGREDVAADLARDAIARAEVVLELGDREAGKAELSAAVAQLEQLVRKSRRKDLEGALYRGRRRLGELDSSD
jgi:serine/threonine protein kinase/tetratricopeptide (TPR) repeat protein